MTQYQIFTNVSELIADQKSLGGDEARLYRAIELASAHLHKKIGWFIPVTLARALKGSGTRTMFVPPLLDVTTITNYNYISEPITLTTDDYLLRPDNRQWPNGPYTRIVFKPYSGRLFAAWSSYPNGVGITGRWGLYELAVLTGSSVGAGGQAVDATTLLVTDGGKVSAGDHLLIGTEQELVTGRDSPTTGITTLGAAQAIDDDTITFANGALVKVGEMIRVGVEKQLIEDINVNTGYVRRAWNGTVRAAHNTGVNVDVYRTFTVERGVNGTTAAVHNAAVAISRYKAPEDIATLTREIATLGLNKAGAGYQGRTGNAELGTVFYNDIFPQFDLREIARNYKIPRV